MHIKHVAPSLDSTLLSQLDHTRHQLALINQVGNQRICPRRQLHCLCGARTRNAVDTLMEPLVEDNSLVRDLQARIKKFGRRTSDAGDLISRLSTLGRSVDADDFAAFALGDGTNYEACM